MITVISIDDLREQLKDKDKKIKELKEALTHTRNEIRSLTRVSDEEANILIKYIEIYLVD